MTARTDALRQLEGLCEAAVPTLRDALDDPTPEHWQAAREMAARLEAWAWDVQQQEMEVERV